jgi:serine/threonine-protein phosphatase PGAM5
VAAAVAVARLQESVLLGDLAPTPAPGEEQAYPQRLQVWLDGVDPARRDPGGVRLAQAFEHFATEFEPGPVVLVTHAFVIGWFVRTAIEAPAHRWMELFPDRASLTTIAFRDDDRPPALVRFNDTGHLA